MLSQGDSAAMVGPGAHEGARHDDLFPQCPAIHLVTRLRTLGEGVIIALETSHYDG